LNLLLVGGVFFLLIGLLAAVITVARDSPSGLVVNSGVFGATLGIVFPILVGIILVRLGTKRSRFSKHNR
jgi:Na+/glutamate symporter